MSTAETKALIEEAIANFQAEVPALKQLRLVIELELRGRGDIQLFRVEVPGPRITRDIASDAKVRLSVPRSHFNELAREGKVRDWREAFQSGTVKATGPAEILKLIQNVVEKQEERGRTRKLRAKRAGACRLSGRRTTARSWLGRRARTCGETCGRTPRPPTPRLPTRSP